MKRKHKSFSYTRRKILFDGGNIHLIGTVLEAEALVADAKKWKEEPSYVREKKEGQNIVGYYVLSKLNDVYSEKTTPVSMKILCDFVDINNDATESVVGKTNYSEEITCKNTQLTPFSRTAIVLGCILTSQYCELSSTLCGKLGIQQTTPFIKYGMRAFTGTALHQSVTTVVSFEIGDKEWHKNVLSKEALVQLFVGSFTAGCIGEFGVHILGDAYDPCKLPSFWKEGSCSWSQISLNQLFSHSALLVANEAEHIVLNMFSDEKWTLKAFFTRLLIYEISSLAAHGSTKLGEMYGGGKLNPSYTGRKLSYWQHKIGHGLLAGTHQASLSAINYLLGDDDEFDYGQCFLNVFASSCGAVMAEIFAERKLFKNKTMHEYLEDREGFEITSNKQFRERGEKAAFFGKLMGLVPGIVTLNAGALSSSYIAAANAVDYNFIVVLGVISIGLSLYDLHDAYQKGGVEGFLKQLGFEVITNVTGNFVLKHGGRIYKFSNATKAVHFIYKKVPFLDKIIGKSTEMTRLLIKTEEKAINYALKIMPSKALYIHKMPWKTGRKSFAAGWKFEDVYQKNLNSKATHLGKTYPVFDFFQ